MPRYLITGGAGFIGGALAAALARDGAEVTILDLPEKLARSALDPGHGVVSGSVAEHATWQEVSRRGSFDAVLHLAAQTSGRVSHEQPEMDVESNAKGTLLLADWCRREGVERLLYASSMAVYGQPDEMPVSERTPPSPGSYYGVSKLAGEHYLRAAGLRYTVFRLFNVYGPGQDMENLKQGMVSIYLAYVLAGEKVPVTGSLDRFRDFIHVDDVVEAWRRALTVGGEVAARRIYNLGSGVKTTVRELLEGIITACGHDPASYPVENVGGHYGDTFGIVSDSSLFGRDFGWRPRVDLASGIASMVDWLRPEDGRSRRS